MVTGARLRHLAACGLGMFVFGIVPSASGAGPAAPNTVKEGLSSFPQPLLARHTALKHKLAQLSPTGHYIVVDTGRNRLYVKRGKDTVLSALASTGSGTILDK